MSGSLSQPFCFLIKIKLQQEFCSAGLFAPLMSNQVPHPGEVQCPTLSSARILVGACAQNPHDSQYFLSALFDSLAPTMLPRFFLVHAGPGAQPRSPLHSFPPIATVLNEPLFAVKMTLQLWLSFDVGQFLSHGSFFSEKLLIIVAFSDLNLCFSE